MTLTERLSEFVRACFPGLWVQSFKHDDAIVEIACLCRQLSWSLATWDIDRGLSIAGQNEETTATVSAPDPLAALKALAALATQEGRPCWSFATSTVSSAAPRSCRRSTRRSRPASRTGLLSSCWRR